MAASPTAVPSHKTDGGNALATLLAAAAASMHRQQQQQTHVSTEVQSTMINTKINNCSNGKSNSVSSYKHHNRHTTTSEKQKGDKNQSIQHQLEAKRDTLCQLLNLKPASMIDSPLLNLPLADVPPSNTPLNKRSTSSSPSSIHHLLSSKSKMEIQHNHHHHNHLHQNKIDKPGRLLAKQDESQMSETTKQNGVHKNQLMNLESSCNKDLSYEKYKRWAGIKSVSSAATSTGTFTTKSRNKTNHKSSTSSSSSTDKETTNAVKLPAELINGVSKLAAEATEVELRNLESWHDEDMERIDDSCYQELVDSSNSKGWSADEMFKYNEKMHKISSSYNEKTLSDNYTTPLPRINSKNTMKIVSQLAKEIEERVIAEGRITPESSDDDELFHIERVRRIQLKQQKHLDQLRNLQTQPTNRFSSSQVNLMNNVASKTNKSSSHCSNSTETPATVSVSSSPTLNDTVTKFVTSSSRNILRTCLT